MSFALAAIVLITLASAAIAMTLRNLIHSALLLIGSWAGIAGFYLWAGAEFVAFAQLMIYVGAVSMIVLFAVLLTQHSATYPGDSAGSLGRAVAALVVGGGVLGILTGAVLSSRFGTANRPAPTVSVKDIGTQLMGPQTLALLVVGALLTVALLGAVVIAATARAESRKDKV